MEEWRSAFGTACRYEVSTIGRVRRQDGYVLKASEPRNTREYPAVMLRLGGKRRRVAVHRLVALTFLGDGFRHGMEVCHINGNHRDPRLCNLKWGSRKDNAADRDGHGRTAIGERHGKARLTDEQRRAVEQSSEPTAALADRFGVHRTTIQKSRAAALRARAIVEGEG